MKAWKSDSVMAGRMSQVKSPGKTKSLTVNANEVYKCNPLTGMMNDECNDNSRTELRAFR